MKSVLFMIAILTAGALFFGAPSVYADTEQTVAGTPPVSQPLVREGTLAVDLAGALGLGTASDEIEAEGMLGVIGIAPRNGWIADYPVTPDIVGELESAVSEAADAGRLTMSKDEALKAFHDVLGRYELAVRPSAPDQTAEAETPYDKPDPTVINNYYYDYGPPVVTYYAPPPYFYSLYTWVPYPFWWWDFRFHGFFVLVDFHKHIFVHGHKAFVTNHFFYHKDRRFVRIDPVDRFHGKTFRGSGAVDTKGFVSSGKGSGSRFAVSGRDRAIPGGGNTFVGDRKTSGTPTRSISGPSGDRSRTFSSPSVTGRRDMPRSGGDRMFNAPSGNRRTSVVPSDSGRTFSPSGGNRSFVAPSGSGRTFGSPSIGSRSSVPSSGGGRSFSAPSGSGSSRIFSAPRATGGTFGSSGRGSRGSFGGGHRR
jgi:hypothetical protein